MNSTFFRGFLLLLLVMGALLGRYQSAQIATTREAIAARRASLASPAAAPLTPSPSAEPEPQQSRPSVELLALRAEATRLRHELDLLSPPAQAITRAADEWALVFDGVRPSQQPGFVHFSSLAPAGFAHPSAAMATFQHAMRHQVQEPLTPTRMKDLWDVPDDFDDPNARYSIHLGAGVGGEIGYRVVREEPLEPGVVRLTLEMENPDGSSFRQERVLVDRNGHWRLRPERLERLSPSADGG